MIYRRTGAAQVIGFGVRASLGEAGEPVQRLMVSPLQDGGWQWPGHEGAKPSSCMLVEREVGLRASCVNVDGDLGGAERADRASTTSSVNGSTSTSSETSLGMTGQDRMECSKRAPQQPSGRTSRIRDAPTIQSRRGWTRRLRLRKFKNGQTSPVE